MDAWTPQDREEFGRRLQLARLALNMTQATVMKSLELGEDKKGTLSAWEVGRTMPTAEMLARLADLYQVSADLLLFGEIGPSQDAIAFAEAYEALTAEEQDAFRALWYGWVNGKIRPPAGPRPLTPGVETASGLSTLPEPVKRVRSPLPNSQPPVGPRHRENLGGIETYRERKHDPNAPTPKPALRKRAAKKR